MIKKLLYTILVLVALSFGGWWLANSEWMLSFAVKQLNSVLAEDRLRIEYKGFDGKLLSHFSIEELTLTNALNGDSLLSIKALEIATNPLLLLQSQRTFNYLSIGHFTTKISQDSTDALWQFISKDRPSDGGIPPFKLHKIAVNEANVSFESSTFGVDLAQFSFDIGASYSPTKGFTLALPVAKGNLSYTPYASDTLPLSWDFSLSAGTSYNPYGQLVIASTSSGNETTLSYPLPSLIQAKIEADTSAKNVSHLRLGASFTESSQLSVDLSLSLNSPKQEVTILPNASISWAKPTQSFALADSLSIPEIHELELRNTSAIAFGLDGLLVDSIGYALGINGIDGKSYGLHDLGISIDGAYNFPENTSSHRLSIVSEAMPNSPFNLAVQTSYKAPIIYGKIQSTSKQQLFINTLLLEPLDVDFKLNGWQWAQDLNYNLTDDFFEGSLKIGLPKSVLNTVQFSSFLINGRYSAIGANIDVLAKSTAGDFGVQVFGVHFEDAVEHEIKVDLQGLDLGKWLDIEGFNTRISATGSIVGSGKSPFETESAIDFYFKESFIQKARIDTARLTASLKSGLLTIEQLALESDLAEGLFSASMDLNEVFAPTNTLEGYLELKNPTSLAPLFGLDTLNATGFLTTKISPDINGNISLLGSFDVENLRFGMNQKIGKIDGIMRIPMQKEPTLEVFFNIYDANISNAKLSNLSNSITAKLGSDSIEGSLRSYFQNGEAYSANIRSHFIHDKERNTTQISLDTLFIKHNTDSLKLQQPSVIELAKNRIQVNPITLTNDRTGSELSLSFLRIDDQIEGFFKATSFDLYKAQQCFLVEQPVEGAITTNLVWYGTANNLTISGPFKLDGLAYKELKIPSLVGELSLNNSALSLQTSIYASSSDTLKLADISFQANINLLDSIKADISIPENTLSNWKAIHPSLNTALEAKFSAKTQLSGPISQPTINGFIALKQLRDGDNTFADSLMVNFVQDDNNGRFQLDGSAYLLAKNALELSLESPKIGYISEVSENNEDSSFPFPADSSMTISLSTTDFDLKFLNSIKPINEQIQIGKGFLNTKLYASGPIKDLFPKGNLVVDQLDITWLELGLTHQASYVNLALERDKVSIQNALLRGDQGSIKAQGSWVIPTSNLANSPIDLSIKFENFLSLNNALGRFRTNGSLNFSGNNAEPKLNGDLQLSRGKLVIDALENRDIEDVRLNNEDTVSYFDFNKWLFGLQSAIEVSITEDLSIRNRSFPRVEIYPVGKLNVLKAKDQEEWQVFGGLLATRGSVELLGKRFQLEDSRVDFDGNPMNPNLSIEAMYRIPKPHEVTIWYGVSGNLNEPIFSYRSNPEMELQNMISYLLFNKPFYALESWEQSLAATDQDAGGSASNIAIQLLANRIEQIAAQRLGIDLVQIDNTRTGSRNATTLKTGWYLNDKTFFAIVNELGVTNPQTQFILEYLIGRDLNLILTQTNDDGSRLDLRWRYDY